MIKKICITSVLSTILSPFFNFDNFSFSVNNKFWQIIWFFLIGRFLFENIGWILTNFVRHMIIIQWYTVLDLCTGLTMVSVFYYMRTFHEWDILICWIGLSWSSLSLKQNAIKFIYKGSFEFCLLHAIILLIMMVLSESFVEVVTSTSVIKKKIYFSNISDGRNNRRHFSSVLSNF